MLIALRKTYYLIFILMFSSACTTIYKPSHRFMDQTYQPVKKGVVELEVHKELVLANSEGIKSRGRAYKVGRNNVKRSIKNFCKGKFSIQNISREKEQTGVESITSTTKNSDTSGQFSVVDSGGYESSYVGGRKHGSCSQRNAFGSYPSGGGCNSFGCWVSGGGCNPFGCWYAGGRCSSHKCVNQAPKNICSVLGKRRRRFAYTNPGVSHGHSQKFTQDQMQEYSRTNPTYREYELISFQCQKK